MSYARLYSIASVRRRRKGIITMRVSDYFAELHVAGRLADAGWDIYFPHRDKGFDFVIALDSQN